MALPVGWETGVYSLAYGNDGALLMVSDVGGGSAPVPLRRYDSVTGDTTNISSVFMKSLLTPSGDGSVIAVGEGSVSSGRLYRYDVARRAITGYAQSDQFSWIHPGANRDGTQFTYSMDQATYVIGSNMNHFYTFGGAYLGPRPVGVAYHPSEDLVFMAWGGSSHVIAYETVGFTEVARYDFGTFFGTGERSSYRTRILRDGSLLMINVGAQSSISGGRPHRRKSRRSRPTLRRSLAATRLSRSRQLATGQSATNGGSMALSRTERQMPRSH